MSRILASSVSAASASAHSRKSTIPCALATGATLALAADILANLWPIPLPVGSTLALIGIPLILLILLRQRHA